MMNVDPHDLLGKANAARIVRRQASTGGLMREC
jgi:hypothetical protein